MYGSFCRKTSPSRMPGAVLRCSSVHLTMRSASAEKNWIVGLTTTTSPSSVQIAVA
jgi:hypothetical protein